MNGTSRSTTGPVAPSRTRAAVAVSLIALFTGAGASGALIAAAEADPNSATGAAISAIVPQTDPKSLSGEAYLTAAAGSCLNWKTGPDGGLQTFTAVDCAAPHRFEVARRIDLVGQPGFGAEAPFPTAEQRSTVGRDQCAPVVTEYAVGRPVDPAGRFVATVVPPSAEGWAKGDHSVLCGIATVELDGRPAESLGPFARAEQHRSWEAGTCLGFTATRMPGAPVPCSDEHSIEIAERVDVTPLFPQGQRAPSAQEQATLTADACLRAGTAYLGDAETLRRTTLISTLVAPLSQISWETGSRTVNCGLMKAHPQGGFVSLRGPARQGILLDGAPPLIPTTTTVPPPAAPPAGTGTSAATPARSTAVAPSVPAPDTAPAGDPAPTFLGTLPAPGVVPAAAPPVPAPPAFGIPGLPALPPPP